MNTSFGQNIMGRRRFIFAFQGGFGSGGFGSGRGSGSGGFFGGAGSGDPLLDLEGKQNQG